MAGNSSSKRKVVLVGMCQSGSLSLSAAIHSLGYNTIGYHKPAMARATRGDFSLIDWCASQFDQLRDYPFNTYYGRIADRYPDARFVLTYRLNLDHWFDKLCAYSNTDLKHTQAHRHWWGKPSLTEADREHVKDVHKRHCDHVRSSLTTHELIEWTVDQHDGWNGITKFLGEPIPAYEFPEPETRMEFINHHAARLDKSWMVWETILP